MTESGSSIEQEIKKNLSQAELKTLSLQELKGALNNDSASFADIMNTLQDYSATK